MARRVLPPPRRPISQIVLRHYGVKGMKWGQRKDRGGEPVEVSTTQTPGRRVGASGGQNQPASDDAVRAAKSRQKARASTTDALSNEELRDLVSRIQLEQNYAKLTYRPSKLKRTNDFIKNLLGVGRTANEAIAFANSPAGKRIQAEFDRAQSQARAGS